MKTNLCLVILIVCVNLSCQRVMQNSFHDLKENDKDEKESNHCAHYADMSSAVPDSASKHPNVGYSYYCETNTPAVASVCPPISVIKANFDYAAHNCPEPSKCKTYGGGTYYCALTCKDKNNQ